MKRIYPGTVALLALAGAALVPPSAKAATVTTVYTQGDLLLGFHQSGTTNDLLVDIGPASNYINATSAFTISFGVIPGTSTSVTNLSADLAAVFGSSWASNTQTNLVQWGIAGDTDHFTDGATFGLPKNTLFLTQAEATPGVQSTPLQRFKTGTAGTLDGTLNSLATGSFGFSNSTSTVNSTVATIQPIAQSNSWVSFNPGSNAFGTGYNIEQLPAGTNIGPTNSVLDLYQLQPNTVNGGNGTYLGNFTLDSGGKLTFTPTPEPSTFAMIGLGVLFLATRRTRATPPIA